MISELHAHGAEVPCPTHRIREDFAVPFCAHLKRSINQNQADHLADLRSILAPYRERLTYLADRTESLADRMKAADSAMQLCHTDAHGWNLMQNRYLMLIDWEGLKLAPVEADLFMFYDKPFWERFLSVYRKKHPRFVVSLDAMDFYLNRRRIEDVWEFIDRILHDPISSDLRDKSMQLLEKELDAVG
jgi:thiamine kinase-like enzyme